MEKEYTPLYPLTQGIVNITGEITSEKAESIVNQMLYLDKTGHDPIILMIDSPGGSVSAGFKIYDTINSVRAKVRTIAVGLAASMGAFLLSAGTYGERMAYPNADIMIHQPLCGMEGQASDIEIQWKHLHRIKQKLNHILAENTGKPVETIAADTDRDYFMTADEAREYGLIDTVIQTTNKAKRGN
ncbi:MAG: ATP-dependent Clp protease proteolytic subunit [Clostridiales bacterium]|nr:ATP-dependent Clp protease proteolytic subunit [Clostridiales bacterium]